MKLNKTWAVWSMMLSIATMSSSLATTCPQALEANHLALLECVKVVDQKNAAITESQLSIEARDKILTETRTELEKEQSKNNAVWRNPLVLIGVGLIGGLLLAK